MSPTYTGDEPLGIVERFGVAKTLRLLLAYVLQRGSAQLHRTARQLVVDLGPPAAALAEPREGSNAEQAEPEEEEVPWFRVLQHAHQQAGSAGLLRDEGTEWEAEAQRLGTGVDAERAQLDVSESHVPAPQPSVPQSSLLRSCVREEAHVWQTPLPGPPCISATEHLTGRSAPTTQTLEAGRSDSRRCKPDGSLDYRERKLALTAEQAHHNRLGLLRSRDNGCFADASLDVGAELEDEHAGAQPRDAEIHRNGMEPRSSCETVPGRAMPEKVRQGASSGYEATEIGRAAATSARPPVSSAGRGTMGRNAAECQPCTGREGSEIGDGEFPLKQWPALLPPSQQLPRGSAAMQDWPSPLPQEHRASAPAHEDASDVRSGRNGFGAGPYSVKHEPLPGAAPRETNALGWSEGWPELPQTPVYVNAGRELERYQRDQRRSDEQRGIF